MANGLLSAGVLAYIAIPSFREKLDSIFAGSPNPDGSQDPPVTQPPPDVVDPIPDPPDVIDPGTNPGDDNQGGGNDDDDTTGGDDDGGGDDGGSSGVGPYPTTPRNFLDQIQPGTRYVDVFGIDVDSVSYYMSYDPFSVPLWQRLFIRHYRPDVWQAANGRNSGNERYDDSVTGINLYMDSKRNTLGYWEGYYEIHATIRIRGSEHGMNVSPASRKFAPDGETPIPVFDALMLLVGTGVPSRVKFVTGALETTIDRYHSVPAPMIRHSDFASGKGFNFVDSIEQICSPGEMKIKRLSHGASLL